MRLAYLYVKVSKNRAKLPRPVHAPYHIDLGNKELLSKGQRMFASTLFTGIKKDEHFAMIAFLYNSQLITLESKCPNRRIQHRTQRLVALAYQRLP